MGYLNASLYTGEVEYTSIDGDPTYWLIDLTCQSPIPSFGPSLVYFFLTNHLYLAPYVA